jgi:hypothetical protein
VRSSVAKGLGDYCAANWAYQTAFDMLQYVTTEPPAPGYDYVSSIAEKAMAVDLLKFSTNKPYAVKE